MRYGIRDSSAVLQVFGTKTLKIKVNTTCCGLGRGLVWWGWVTSGKFKELDQ